MKNKQFPIKKKILIPVACLAVLCIAAATFFLYRFPQERRDDYNRLSTEGYDTVFLSMYPTDYFYEGDFAFWRGMTTVKTSYNIPDFSALQSYMKQIATSGNTISTIYIAVMPEKLSSEKLAELVQTYSSVHFELILPNPSLDYWLDLSEAECTTQLAYYKDFANLLLPYGNVSLYHFASSEWLVCNPANYCNTFLTNEKASLTLMLNADRDHPYLLTAENAEQKLAELDALIEQYRNTPADYPDLSDCTIVFLGDSVIGNYTGSTSIPGAVGGLTGAQVFNLGYGGASATEYIGDNCSLPDTIQALVEEDISLVPEDTQLYVGMSEYLKADTTDNLCFVINFGLNDYFTGFPIKSENPYDIYTYTGAIRVAVENLQQNLPNAHILLMTPNFTSFFNNGTDYRDNQEHILAEYADALSELSKELNVGLLDNFNELGITPQNHSLYLADGCHPNETGRFLIAQRISQKLDEWY